MAVMEQTYAQPPEILWNALNDIVELRKGHVTYSDSESMTVETEMYCIKTEYCFHVACPTVAATVVKIETCGEGADDKRGLQLLFATLENMLLPFMETGEM